MITSELAVNSKNSAVFLDRDGVINTEVNYCHKIDDFTFVPGIFDVLRLLQKRYDHLIIVTNQAGIGRGYYTEAQFEALTEWMTRQLVSEGITITQVFYCPHHPDGVPPYNVQCDCRKPEPGMLVKAMNAWNIDPDASILIGDKSSDIAAARRAGLSKAWLVGTGHRVTAADIALSDAYFPSMQQLVQLLKENSSCVK